MLDLSGYKLTFADEFNTRSIGQPGSGATWADIRSDWRFDANSDIGFGHSSFVDPASGYDPFQVQGGALTITAVPDRTASGYPGSWETGLITTQGTFSQTYGYFEIRADFSDRPGAWDAFWLMPDDQGKVVGQDSWRELDIIEHYGDWDRGVYSHIHTTDQTPDIPWQQNRQVYSDLADPSGYHTYGVNWQPDRLDFYVDGKLVGSQATPSDMHGPMYLIANLATQGYGTNNADIAGVPISSKIDYVRVYSNAPAAVAVAQDAVSAPDGADPGLYGATAASSQNGSGSQPDAPADTSSPDASTPAIDTPPAATAPVPPAPVTDAAPPVAAAPVTDVAAPHPSDPAPVASGDPATSTPVATPEPAFGHHAAQPLGHGALVLNDDGTMLAADLVNGAAQVAQIGQLGRDWQFAGVGDFLNNGQSVALMHNTVTGDVGIVQQSGGQLTVTSVGAYGNEWQPLGSGNFDGVGGQDLLLRDTQSGTLVLATAGQDGKAAYTVVGGIGSDWSTGTQSDAAGRSLNPAGIVGDFLGDGRQGVMLHDARTGDVAVLETVDGKAVSKTVGSLGQDWQFLGSGDFNGDGRVDTLLHNVATGAAAIGSVVDGRMVMADAGSFGADWKGVGTSDANGHTALLLHNDATGQLVAADFAGGTAAFTTLATFGNDWHLLT